MNKIYQMAIGPMVGAGLIALALLIVVGLIIANTTRADEPRINRSFANSISGAGGDLPVFSLNSQPTNSVGQPAWLERRRGAQLGDREVWAGAWFLCSDLTMGGDYAGQHGAVWAGMPEGERVAMLSVCTTVYPEDSQPAGAAPQWLAVDIDPNGFPWVWASAWYSCRHIAGDPPFYASVVTDAALQSWAALSRAQQNSVMEVCNG